MDIPNIVKFGNAKIVSIIKNKPLNIISLILTPRSIDPYHKSNHRMIILSPYLGPPLVNTPSINITKGVTNGSVVSVVSVVYVDEVIIACAICGENSHNMNRHRCYLCNSLDHSWEEHGCSNCGLTSHEFSSKTINIITYVLLLQNIICKCTKLNDDSITSIMQGLVEICDTEVCNTHLSPYFYNCEPSLKLTSIFNMCLINLCFTFSVFYFKDGYLVVSYYDSIYFSGNLEPEKLRHTRKIPIFSI